MLLASRENPGTGGGGRPGGSVGRRWPYLGDSDNGKDVSFAEGQVLLSGTVEVVFGDTFCTGRPNGLAGERGTVSESGPPPNHGDPRPMRGSCPSDANPNRFHLKRMQFGGFWAALGAQMMFCSWDGDRDGAGTHKTAGPRGAGLLQGHGERGTSVPMSLLSPRAISEADGKAGEPAPSLPLLPARRLPASLTSSQEVGVHKSHRGDTSLGTMRPAGGKDN